LAWRWNEDLVAQQVTERRFWPQVPLASEDSNRVRGAWTPRDWYLGHSRRSDSGWIFPRRPIDRRLCSHSPALLLSPDLEAQRADQAPRCDPCSPQREACNRPRGLHRLVQRSPRTNRQSAAGRRQTARVRAATARPSLTRKASAGRSPRRGEGEHYDKAARKYK
jgi:hypothetical protein